MFDFLCFGLPCHLYVCLFVHFIKMIVISLLVTFVVIWKTDPLTLIPLVFTSNIFKTRIISFSHSHVCVVGVERGGYTKGREEKSEWRRRIRGQGRRRTFFRVTCEILNLICFHFCFYETCLSLGCIL